VRIIAKRHGVTAQQVKATCVKLATSVDHETRKAELAIELDRIDELYQRFHKFAMTTEEITPATQAASICIRLSERRSSLWGFDNAPLRSMDATITLIQKPPEQPNSTQRIKAVLDALIAQRPTNAPAPIEIEHDPVENKPEASPE